MEDLQSSEVSALVNRTLYGADDSDQHLMSLFGIALGCRGKRFLELGVRSGTTTRPLILAAMLLDAHLTSVDIDCRNITMDARLRKHWTYVNDDALSYLAGVDLKNQFDLVYIDDWHSYDHVKKELEYLDHLVTPSSIILLHDLMYGNTQPHYHTDLTLDCGQWAHGGPYRAVAELNKQIWEFSTLPWNNGLTILRKKHSTYK